MKDVVWILGMSHGHVPANICNLRTVCKELHGILEVLFWPLYEESHAWFCRRYHLERWEQFAHVLDRNYDHGCGLFSSSRSQYEHYFARACRHYQKNVKGKPFKLILDPLGIN